MKKCNFNTAYSKTRKYDKVIMAEIPRLDSGYNLITLEWFMKTSINPPMYAVSIGHSRYSYECFQQSEYFNIIYPSKQLVDLVRLSGSKSGREIDKFEVSKVDYFLSNYSKLPILRNAAVIFECKIVSQVKSGDHTIFVGEVKKSWENSENEIISVEHLRNN